MVKESILFEDILLIIGFISELFKITELFLVEFSMLENYSLLVADILCKLTKCKLTVTISSSRFFFHFRPTERWSKVDEWFDSYSSVETIDRYPGINEYRDWPELFLVPSDYCK